MCKIQYSKVVGSNAGVDKFMQKEDQYSSTTIKMASRRDCSYT